MSAPRKIPAPAVYDAGRQEYTLTGSGSNMWAKSDQFHFLWKKLKGNFILRARVEFIGKGVELHRKVGWMVRPNLDADAPYVDCAEHGNGLTSLQYRRTAAAISEQIVLTTNSCDVIQFERRGNIYTVLGGEVRRSVADVPVLQTSICRTTCMPGFSYVRTTLL